MKPLQLFGKKYAWSDIFLALLLVLLIIPQTRKPIQVGVNRLKLLVWSPSITTAENPTQIPAFMLMLTDLEGQNQLVQIGDGKPTLLGFWATWCGPCVAEMPSLQALYEDYKDQLNFVLITQEKPAKVQAFMRKKGFSLPVYFTDTSLPERLQTNTLPTNYLIDAQGKLLIEEKGAANWNSKKVRDLLKSLHLED